MIQFLIIIFTLSLFSCSGEGEKAGVSGPPEEVIRLSIEKQKIGAYEEAIQLIDTVLKKDAQNLQAILQKGKILEEWEKREEALSEFQKAISLEPDNIPAHLGSASIYSKLTYTEKAIAEYEKVAVLRPKDPEIHFKIALENWYIQKFPETAASYRKVIEIEPDHLQAHLNLASVYEKMKDWNKAMEELETSIKLAQKKEDKEAIAIAENKKLFLEGRMNQSEKDFDRKTQPPFN